MDRIEDFSIVPDQYEKFDIPPVELLGYAKNCIVEVQVAEPKLPIDVKDRLVKAYLMLDEVQEFLYDN